MNTYEPNTEEMERGRLLFAKECTFITGAVDLGGLPETALAEIAFAGRSNVGKSSLINALTGRKTLARTSNTPGRTQQLNFFDLDGRLMLADLPGYGYARAPKTRVAEWTQLVGDYLRGRPNLRRACVLIDGRHGIKNSDRDVMAMLDAAAVSYQAVLTKCDKIKPADLTDLLGTVTDELKTHVAAHPDIIATSAVKGDGIPELRAALGGLAAHPAEQ